MHIKLLLISQLLALSCTQSWANDTSVHSDEETLDDVHLPHSTTTTLPELELDEKATARPDDGIKKLDESLAIINKGTALPETTIQPIESTSPTTTTTTTTTTTEPQKKAGLPPMHPLAYPHPYAHPYPYPYPYPYPHPEPKATSESSTMPEPGVPSYRGYPYPSYPILRSPYSPYGAPVFHQPGRLPQYPGFARGLVYGNSDSDSAEKPKSAEADESPKSMEQSTEQGPKLPAEHPSYGYPPVYVIQRRPLVPSYPYASPARGYGSPYGYGG